MKTASQILMLMAVISFMSCGQLHVVTLYVNTNDIEIGNEELYANFDQPDGIMNKNFITTVRKGDQIIWKGQSISDPDHVVKITSIEHKDGKEIFELKPFKKIKGKDGYVNKDFSDELVKGKVTLGPSKKEAYIIEHYTLKFTVSNKSGTFTIDPEIRGHPIK